MLTRVKLTRAVLGNVTRPVALVATLLLFATIASEVAETVALETLFYTPTHHTLRIHFCS